MNGMPVHASPPSRLTRPARPLRSTAHLRLTRPTNPRRHLDERQHLRPHVVAPPRHAQRRNRHATRRHEHDARPGAKRLRRRRAQADAAPGRDVLAPLLDRAGHRADDLLAPLFATMAPGYPQQEAAVLAEAFGGPAAPPGSKGHDFTEAQRARRVALATRAADEAGLPADPGFRSAHTSYLEWSSRAGGDAAPPPWDWGPAGPPAPAQVSTAQASPGD